MSMLRWFFDADLEWLRSFINVEAYVMMFTILVIGIGVMLGLADRRGKGAGSVSCIDLTGHVPPVDGLYRASSTTS